MSHINKIADMLAKAGVRVEITPAHIRYRGLFSPEGEPLLRTAELHKFYRDRLRPAVGAVPGFK